MQARMPHLMWYRDVIISCIAHKQMRVSVLCFAPAYNSAQFLLITWTSGFKGVKQLIASTMNKRCRSHGFVNATKVDQILKSRNTIEHQAPETTMEETQRKYSAWKTHELTGPKCVENAADRKTTYGKCMSWHRSYRKTYCKCIKRQTQDACMKNAANLKM